jgi:hypothetical protein
MPLTYNGLGVSVMYPDGWKIEEDATEDSSVSFESPLGAFLTVTRYPELDFSDAVEKAHQVMLAEYDEVESEEFSRTVAERKFDVTALRFVYLDFLIVAELFSFQFRGSTYLVQIQGEDRDIEKLQPVFQAMLTSLFQNAESLTS